MALKTVLRDQHSIITRSLVKVDAQAQQIDSNLSHKLDTVKEEVLEALKIQKTDGLSQLLTDLVVERTKLTSALRILESLQYKDMDLREHAINDPHSGTFEWAFELSETFQRYKRVPVHFIEWLGASDKSIFWISGKAGSGKSTLMKFLSEHEKTLSALDRWAGGARLITARPFFFQSRKRPSKLSEGIAACFVVQNFTLFSRLDSGRFRRAM